MIKTTTSTSFRCLFWEAGDENKTRNQRKEDLYNEAINAKQAYNKYYDENTKLKTKIHQAERELDKKNKLIQTLAQQLNTQPGANFSKLRARPTSSHLISALKNQAKEIKANLIARENELKKLSKSLKITEVQEMDVEMKMFSDECTRLKHIIEEISREKSDQNNANEIAQVEKEMYQQSVLINNLKQENQELANSIQKKEGEKNKIKDLESKTTKLENESKENAKNKKIIKESKEKIAQLRNELVELQKNSKEKAIYIEGQDKLKEVTKQVNILNQELAEKE